MTPVYYSRKRKVSAKRRKHVSINVDSSIYNYVNNIILYPPQGADQREEKRAAEHDDAIMTGLCNIAIPV